MKKRMKVMGIILLIVFGGLIVWNSLLKPWMISLYLANNKMPPITVSSTIAKKVNWEPRIPAVGNFVAINGVEVNAQTSGNVIQIHFNSGEFVEKDQPLIDIDDALDQSTLKFNQAELNLKSLNYKRQTELLKRNATPETNVDEAKALLQEAEAETEKTRTQIEYKHIKAPFSGLLGIRQINLGQFIKPGDTPIVSLQSLDPLFLEFYLPEQNIKRIHKGLDITFTVDEFPDIQFTGKITAINSRVDPNTHNIQIQATVPNCPLESLKNPEKSPLINIKSQQDNKKIIGCNSELNTKNKVRQFLFLPGMFAAIEISQPSIPDTIIVPSTAISWSLYGNSVYVIEKNDKDPESLKVRRQFVTTGEQRGNYTVITSGIKEGQTVVSSGELKLQNGASVVINNSVQLKDYPDPDTLGQ